MNYCWHFRILLQNYVLSANDLLIILPWQTMVRYVLEHPDIIYYQTQPKHIYPLLVELPSWDLSISFSFDHATTSPNHRVDTFLCWVDSSATEHGETTDHCQSSQKPDVLAHGESNWLENGCLLDYLCWQVHERHMFHH